jgi:hypothetical protein
MALWSPVFPKQDDGRSANASVIATESCGWKSRARKTCAVLHVRRVAPTMAR